MSFNWFMENRCKFLQMIRGDILSLPDTITQKNEQTDGEYANYKKQKVMKLMHINNRISCYLRKYYGEKSLFTNEFNSYSFFSNDFLFDPFHVENDRYWARGKRDYLYFIDKLIDYAETEERLNTINTRNLLYKLFILFFISVCTFILLFVKEDYPDFVKLLIDGYVAKFLILVIIMLGTSTLIWLREWRTLLPLFVTMIALYVTMLFTLNGSI